MASTSRQMTKRVPRSGRLRPIVPHSWTRISKADLDVFNDSSMTKLEKEEH